MILQQVLAILLLKQGKYILNRQTKRSSIDGQIDGRMDGWMDGWNGGWMDEWMAMDVQLERQIMMVNNT